MVKLSMGRWEMVGSWEGEVDLVSEDLEDRFLSRHLSLLIFIANDIIVRLDIN